MITIPIKDGTISLANINFTCPYCGQAYSDFTNRYLNRCNKNQSGCTKIKCSCGQWFGMTYNYMSDAVGFELV